MDGIIHVWGVVMVGIIHVWGVVMDGIAAAFVIGFYFGFLTLYAMEEARVRDSGKRKVPSEKVVDTDWR